MQDPERYEANKSTAKKAVSVLLPKLISTLTWKPNEVVLDYGCGAGSTGFNWILPKLEELDSIMYSVDMSPKMVAFAKETYSHERITYAVGNILDVFPYENVGFDKIFSMNVFHYIKDIRKALAGLHKTLKPRGQLAFTMVFGKNYVFNALNELAVSETWKESMKDLSLFYPAWSEYPEGQERSGIQELLESSAFYVKQLEFLWITYRFDSIETLLEFSMSTNPCIDNISPNMHDAFKENLRKIYTRYAGIPLDSSSIELSRFLGIFSSCVVSVKFKFEIPMKFELPKEKLNHHDTYHNNFEKICIRKSSNSRSRAKKSLYLCMSG